MITPRAKYLLLIALVACYVLQTTLVYSDERGQVQLEGEELEGHRLWHANNCQSCHQLYGFGGFLGPDLTNFTARAKIDRLQQVLAGSKQMPPFPQIGEAERRALWAFFEAMNRTGQGEARVAAPEGGSRQQRLNAVLEARLAEGTPERRGHEALSRRACVLCHVPFQVGVAGAPDQTSVVSRLDDAAILEVLTNGRPGTAMPPPAPPFSDEERRDVLSLLHWEWQHRDELIEATVTPTPVFRFSELPWWEYRPASPESER